MNQATVPRIVQILMEAAHKFAKADLETERFCCLVSDSEWREICTYVSRFEYRDWLPDEKITSMHFAGIEVVKRSSHQTGPKP